MKKSLLIFSGLLLITVIACQKVSFDKSPQGEAIGQFTLSGPASNSQLLLNSADPNSTIVISWTAAAPGLNDSISYSWIAAPLTGSLDAPTISVASDNGGRSNKLTLTQKQLDDVLKNAGVAAAAKVDLKWTVKATNSSGTTVLAGNVFNISITRFGDGISGFRIYGPLSSTTNLEINPTSTTDSITFKWQKAVPSVPANPIKYQLTFIKEGGNFNQPLFVVTPGNNGTDTTVKLSWKQISDSLNAKGLSDLSQVANLKWNVKATSGNFSSWSQFENQLNILRKVSFYIVGSINGWDINNPIEIIADKKADRYAKVFYTYIQLNAGDEFKFFKVKGDWGSGYGNAGGGPTDFTTGYNQGGNFQITTPGVYRLTIDAGNNKAYIQQKQVGVVGNMQGWNPGAPIFGGYYGRNKFLIIANSSGSDEFKLHDGPVWDNGTPDKARWWGIGGAAGTLDVDGNGANLLANSTPRTRVIWDGTDPQQVKYELHSAVEMRVVGDGINVGGVNAWDPPTSPQMTYIGNGRWQISLALYANKDIKFLAGAAWGAFDYEDAGGGKIKWDGGNNFKTPAIAGTYTITLDEHAGTITIN